MTCFCRSADVFITLMFQSFVNYFNTMGEPNHMLLYKIASISNVNSLSLSNNKLLICNHILIIFKSVCVDTLSHAPTHKSLDAFTVSLNLYSVI